MRSAPFRSSAPGLDPNPTHMTKRAVVVAVTSDQHANSTLGLCPTEGVQLDDGGFYHPSKAQRWTWRCWLDFWKRVAAVRKEQDADLVCVFNGDAVDGPDHHGTSQVISRNVEVQSYVAGRVFSIPQGLKPERMYMVRGTEVHVGQSASSEEALAKSLQCERAATRTWSHWHLILLVHGRLFDFQHHASVGGLPWTRPGGVARLAFRHWVERTQRNLRPADVMFRSHLHVHGDSFGHHKTRAIITPAWQLKTSHAHKIAPESIADIGGIIATIHPDRRRRIEVEPVLYEPRLPTPQKVT